MLYPNIMKLTEAKAAVEALERSIAKDLAGLPSDYGFASMEEFIVAVKAAGRGKHRGPGRPTVDKVRRRAKITEGTRKKVGKLVKAGKSGSQIAKTLRISLPSVQNIKKALGLVESPKKSAVKTKGFKVDSKRGASRSTRKKRSEPRKPAVPIAKPAETTAEAVPEQKA
jgi:hypothetical protein